MTLVNNIIYKYFYLDMCWADRLKICIARNVVGYVTASQTALTVRDTPENYTQRQQLV